MNDEDKKRLEEIRRLDRHTGVEHFLLRVIEEQSTYIRERQGRIDEKLHEAAEVMEGALRQVGWTAMSAYQAVEDWLDVEWNSKLQDFVYPDGRRLNQQPLTTVTVAQEIGPAPVVDKPQDCSLCQDTGVAEIDNDGPNRPIFGPCPGLHGKDPA